MNAYLNYLLEASIGLCLFLFAYQLLLRKETSFRFNRMFLLTGLGASILFPLIKINAANSPMPSLNLSVEPVVAEAGLVYSNEVIPQNSWTPWEIAAVIYGIGLTLFLLVFATRLFRMFITLRQSSHYDLQNHHIVELKDTSSPFSFFNYIFIGNTPPLTDNEKQQIIEHESIHAKLFHSVDIVLLNILGIVFWFNPIIRVYKKIFVQLHEFEADARAVETHDVNAYCSLLARVALHSADYKLASHFGNSLTVKRIEMMRTIKQKIKSWKMVAVAAFVPALFFVVSCQDQIENGAQYIERPFEYPPAVRDALADLGKKYPNDLFITLSPSGESIQFDESQKDRLAVRLNDETTFTADAINIIKVDGKNARGEQELWIIFQYKDGIGLPTDEQLKAVAPEVYREIDARPVFTAVETAAIPPGGMEAFAKSLSEKIRYPASAKRAGIEGKVFIAFTVWSDGKVSGYQIMKGVNKEIDQEALRVLKELSATGWTPGMHKGGKVNSQYVMPVTFTLH